MYLDYLALSIGLLLIVEHKMVALHCICPKQPILVLCLCVFFTFKICCIWCFMCTMILFIPWVALIGTSLFLVAPQLVIWFLLIGQSVCSMLYVNVRPECGISILRQTSAYALNLDANPSQKMCWAILSFDNLLSYTIKCSLISVIIMIWVWM